MVKKMHKIIINKDPVACTRPRVTRFGVYYPKKYQEYKDYLKDYLISLNLKKLEDNALYLNIIFNIQIPNSMSKKKKQELIGKYVIKKPDIDNYLKSIMDGMNGIIYKDDNQIASINIIKKYVIDNPNSEIEIGYL